MRAVQARPPGADPQIGAYVTDRFLMVARTETG